MLEVKPTSTWKKKKKVPNVPKIAVFTAEPAFKNDWISAGAGNLRGFVVGSLLWLVCVAFQSAVVDRPKVLSSSSCI